MKNKQAKIKLFLAIVLLGGFFILGKMANAAPTDIVISEIMYDANGSDTDKEWVEIYNSGNEAVTVVEGSGTDSWRFNDGSNHTLTLVQGSLTIPAQGTTILSSDAATFLADRPGFSGTVIDTVMSLNNTSDTLKLSADKGATFFGEITYQNTWGGNGDGKTLEKINLTGDNSQSNWRASSVDGGTPGSITSETPPEPSAPAPSTPTTSMPTPTIVVIKINEVYPHPAKEDEPEFIELCNRGGSSATLSGWKLADTKKVVNLPETTLVSQECKSFNNNTTKITLNNSNETIYLYNPSGEVVDKISWTSSIKGQSLSWDETQNKWLWSAKPTPDQNNEISKINEPPQPRITFSNNPAAPLEEIIISASESTDPDDDPLFFSWSIGDNFQASGESFLFRFDSLGSHLVKLMANDGQHAALATSSVEILLAEEIISKRSKTNLATTTPQAVAPAKKRVTSKKTTVATSTNDIIYIDDNLIDVDLANIHELELGTTVRVQGTVAVPPGVLAKTYFYITGSPGIQVYFSKKDWPKLSLGDVVGILGELTETGGELRLKVVSKQDIVPLYKSQPPTPTEANTGEIGEELEGSLIKTSGELSEKKGTSWLIDDGSGEAKITFQATAKIKKPTIKVGEWVEIVGLVGETKTGYRILPRYSSDIKVLNDEEVADKLGTVLGESATNTDALARFRIPANNRPQTILKYLLITSIALVVLLAGLLIKFWVESKKRMEEIKK